MPYRDRTVPRAEPCKQCGSPVNVTVRTWTTPSGSFLKEAVIATECDHGCAAPV